MHRTQQELIAYLAQLPTASTEHGKVLAVFARPQVGVRERLREAILDVEQGLIGDNWKARGSRRMADGSAHPDMQVTLMNAHVLDAIAGNPERWALAGDQLIVDLDVSSANLPPGTRLRAGNAILEITAQPHNGCAKFAQRYGADALAFVNTVQGREQRLRGVYARVVHSGPVREGDVIAKLA